MSKQKPPTILFKRPIVLKSIVTEAFKGEKEKELNKAVADCEQSVRQLTEHMQKNHLKPEERSRLEEEIKKIAVQGAILKERVKKLREMKPGDYFIEQSLEGLISVRKGDDIRQKLTRVDIISKDYIVQDVVEVNALSDTKQRLS
ncbi:MAG: YlqD family protein [Waddliaceae bacterium]